MAGPGGASLKSLSKNERPRSTWPAIRRLLSYLRPYPREVSTAIAWIVVSSAATAASPALTGRIIDTAVAAQASGASARVLIAPVTALAGVALIGWWAQRGQILRFGQAGQMALFELRSQVFGKVHDLSVAFFESSESGDIMSRLINDIEQVSSFLSRGFRRVISASLGLIATLAGMLWVDWRLALATLLVLPLMFLATRLFAAIARRAFRKRQETIGEVSSALAEELGGIKVAQAFNRTGQNADRFAMRNAANRDANISAAAVSSAFSPVLSVISTVATALVAVFGGWLAIQQLVTIGVVVAFFNYSRQFFNAVSQLSSLYAETQAALAGGERVFELLDMSSSVTDSPSATAIGRAAGSLSFEDVSFSYGTGPEVLHHIQLRIAAGETVAIVGATGAGKSTLVNLVARFYDPTSGSVLLDDTDLRELTVGSVRSNLGMVLQDPFLFAGSIADNIRYGRLEASAEEVAAAARLARVMEFAQHLPDVLETEVGERGSLLSTGQRQLIAFGRAVLADPAVLILDEATSSVDTRTESLIQDALRAVLKKRTALIIAHRLSTVRDADRIVVLDRGRIVEQGTYGALLAADGAFARLHEAQFAE